MILTLGEKRVGLKEDDPEAVAITKRNIAEIIVVWLTSAKRTKY